MTKCSLIFITLSFIACNGAIKNEKLKNEIDKLQFNECNLFVKTDSLGNHIDTVKLEKLKFDNEGNKVFKYNEYEIDGQKFISTTYLWEEGTEFITSTNSSSDDFYSYAELFKNGLNKFDKMTTIERFGDESDTLNFIYIHSGQETIVKSTSGEEQIETIYKYDENDKIILEIFIIEKDTFSISNYIYEKGKVKSKTTKKYDEQTMQIINDYDVNNNLIVKSEIGINHRQDSINNFLRYFYNNKNELVSFIEQDKVSNMMKYYKIIKSTCD